MTRRRVKLGLVAGPVLAFALVPQTASAMSAVFTWAGIAPCEKVSPAFTLKDVPRDTENLRFELRDNDAPHFEHGGSTVIYEGPKVPQGAVSYIGPCPPKGSVHHYVWMIEALDGKGKVLDKTMASGTFPMQ